MMLPRTAFCLFCDDFRQEVNSKASYMGTYPAVLAFPPNPPPEAQLWLPKIVVAIWLIIDIEDKLERATFSITMPPGQTEVFRSDVPLEQLARPANMESWTRRQLIHTVVPLFNLVFPHEGFIEVNIETEQGRMSAGRLKVQVPGRPDPISLSSAT